MADCTSTLAALMAPSTDFPESLGNSDDNVDVSSFTTTSESSPPYSSEHHSPTDLRTETPTSDSGNASFSPENVATSFESSDRDASPDNLSTSSTAMNDLQDKGGSVEEDLQRREFHPRLIFFSFFNQCLSELLRFHQDFKDSLLENNQNTINMMSAFNQQLFKQTLANLNTVTPQVFNSCG
uniref:Uncharacterized protein n=1 Tax=Caenorhabditis japonica TaxID=281687 RepID=A0A8R1EF68_CAEJA